MIGLPDIRPHVEELPIFVENLNTAVPAIGDIQAAILVDCNRVHRVELAGPGARRSPRHEILSVFVELDHASVRVAVGDVEGAVGKPGDVCRPAEMLIVVAGDARLAQSHQELLSVVAEFEDLLPHVVNHPDVSLGIVWADLDCVRAPAALKELVPLRPGFDQLAIRIHDDDAVAQFRLLTCGRGSERPPGAVEVVGKLFRKLDLAAICHEDPVG